MTYKLRYYIGKYTSCDSVHACWLSAADSDNMVMYTFVAYNSG